MSHGADLENQLAEHQFIAAALRKCPDVVSLAGVVRVTRVKITEGEGLHTIEESHDLVHGAIVAFGDPEIVRSVYVFVDKHAKSLCSWLMNTPVNSARAHLGLSGIDMPQSA